MWGYFTKDGINNMAKSPLELSNQIIDKDFTKPYQDANIKMSKDIIGGSDYLDENGYFIHNRGSHGEAEDRIIEKYKDNPDLAKKHNHWITFNTITLNSKPDEHYVLLSKEPNEQQYNQLVNWLDRFYNQLGWMEINYQDSPLGKHLGHKTYYTNSSLVDDIIKDIRNFYSARKYNS